MITTTYDPDADAFYLRLIKDVDIADTIEVAPGIMLDRDATGRVLGIEVTSVRARSATEMHALVAA